MSKKEAITKKLNSDEVHALLKTITKFEGNPDKLMDELGTLLPQLENTPIDEQDELLPEVEKKAYEAVLMNTLETHISVSEAVSKSYRPLAITMSKKFIAEYQCKTPSEISVAQIAAIEYVRTMEYAKILNGALRIEYISSEKNGYYSLLGKELDRAERRMITALSTLKQMKSPTLNVHFKANTAFVAQNQQINTDSNNTQESNTNQDEKINAPK